MSELRVKDEAGFRLDWKAKDILRQIKSIDLLSLPSLQNLYTIYFKEDATLCEDNKQLARKLMYLLQYRHMRFHGKPMGSLLVNRTKVILRTPITLTQDPDGSEGSTFMKKSALAASAKASFKTKTRPAPEPEEVEEPEEELQEEEPTEEAVEEELEGEAEEELDPATEEAVEEAMEGEAAVEDKSAKKRSAPVRTGVPVQFSLRNERTGKGIKLTASYVYEAMVKIFKYNHKIKATDQDIQAVVQTTWPSINFEVYRVNADRKKYNAGKFTGQAGAITKGTPEYAIEYNDKGGERIREIPDQLKPFVVRGQTVAKTIAQVKAKAVGVPLARPKPKAGA